MNLEYLAAEEEGTRSYHGKKDCDGTKDGLRWCYVPDLLCEVKAIDG